MIIKNSDFNKIKDCIELAIAYAKTNKQTLKAEKVKINRMEGRVKI